MKLPVPPFMAPVPGTLAASGASPRSWLRERLWLVDLLVSIGVFLYNLPILPIYADGPVQAGALLAVSVALCTVYLLRRRFPAGVLGVMLLAASVQLLLGAPLLAVDAMLLFAVYNVATRYIWQVSIFGAALTVGWLLVAVIPHLGDDVVDLGQLGVLVVVTLWVWTWGTLVRVRRQFVEGLQGRAEQAERERETNAQIAVAQERARIAREIHDIVSHSLSVVILMSDGAAAKVEAEPERARSAMLHVRDTGRGALAEMRRMLGVLREDEPGSRAPQPGIAQLDVMVEQSRTGGMPVSLTVAGETVPLPEGVSSTVYRLVQEALTNVRKHAGPDVTRVEVHLECRPSEIEVIIVDDGRGTSVHPQPAGSGHGQVGMRERVAAHGGTLTTGPHVGGGFEVVATLPLEGGS